ncbi:MAG: hypothetical protein IJS08_05445 [Victivallales bacterium]|nr:hypothetical protein [Victivallales bacterium]
MGARLIETVEIQGFESRWGTKINDYKMNAPNVAASSTNTPVDLQDLMTFVALDRATVVEAEVNPLSTRMTNRNNWLEQLSTALAECTKWQSSFESDDDPDEPMGRDDEAPKLFTRDTAKVLSDSRCGFTFFNNWETWDDGDFDDDQDDWNDYDCCRIMNKGLDGYYATKAQLDGLVSKLKNVIDGENNSAQTDMSRLESLVDRRDEAYTTASDLMSSISGTRDNAIGNL